MIKLIAADLDGTLLDSNRRLSPDLAPLLHQLKTMGIRFTPASGRQYYNLVALFPEFENELMFIAENGAMTVDRGQTIFVDAIPLDYLRDALAIARSVPNAHAIFAGEFTAYYEDDDIIFHENATKYYARLQKVPDLMEAATHDRICKIAIFEHQNAETGCYPLLLPCKNHFQVSLSGADWVDLMNPTVNKGCAMRALQQKMGITPDECMAFGDYLNDLELLQSVTHSFAMQNAHPALKSISRYIAPSNDENGVVTAIQNFLKL